jgi:hypothetical protein
MSYKAVGDGEVKRGHGSKVVKHSPRNLKIKGLNIVTGTGKKDISGALINYDGTPFILNFCFPQIAPDSLKRGSVVRFSDEDVLVSTL